MPSKSNFILYVKLPRNMKAGYLLPTTLSIRDLTLAEIITPENIWNDVIPELLREPWSRKQILAKNQIFFDSPRCVQQSLRPSPYGTLRLEFVVVPLYCINPTHPVKESKSWHKNTQNQTMQIYLFIKREDLHI